MPKTTTQHTYIGATHQSIAQFLQHSAGIDFNNPYPTASSDPAINGQAESDHFHNVAHNLLDQYYPERVVTRSSRDPSYVTPGIESMLRCKNKLMRAGLLEEGDRN